MPQVKAQMDLDRFLESLSSDELIEFSKFEDLEQYFRASPSTTRSIPGSSN